MIVLIIGGTLSAMNKACKSSITRGALRCRLCCGITRELSRPNKQKLRMRGLGWLRSFAKLAAISRVKQSRDYLVKRSRLPISRTLGAWIGDKSASCSASSGSPSAFKFDELIGQGGANKWQSLKRGLAPMPSPQLSRRYLR